MFPLRVNLDFFWKILKNQKLISQFIVPLLSHSKCKKKKIDPTFLGPVSGNTTIFWGGSNLRCHIIDLFSLVFMFNQ